MSRLDVLGVGAVCTDLIIRIAQPPRPVGPASKMRIRSHARLCGGQAATTLAACARFGLRCAYVGAFGADGNGSIARAELARRGIDLSAAVTKDAPGAFAIILVDDSGERMVLWHRDQRLSLEPQSVPAALIREARIVHVDDVDYGAAVQAARLAAEAGTIVTSDIEQVTDLTGALLTWVTIPILAETALSEISGTADVERALRKLQAGSGKLVCVTLGARGAMAVDGEQLYFEEAFPVTTEDTTGAGDIFRAGFVYGLLRQWPTPAILRFANAAAAIACTRSGAVPSVPDLGQVEALARTRSV